MERRGIYDKWESDDNTMSFPGVSNRSLSFVVVGTLTFISMSTALFNYSLIKNMKEMVMDHSEVSHSITTKVDTLAVQMQINKQDIIDTVGTR